MKLLLLLPLTLVPIGTFFSTTSNTPLAEKDSLATAIQAGQFKTLARALDAAELLQVLQGEGPFTVFAPTDEAFAKLPEGTLANLLEPKNKAKLQSILKYHVVAGALPAAQLVDAKHAATWAGQRIEFATRGDAVTVDGANISKANLHCSNGILHAIDALILPADKDLFATAEAAGTFATLATAVRAAGLTETLSGEGPFTIFAPTDEAFAALPEGTLESLLEPPNKQRLKEILTYHMAAGAVYSDMLAESDKLTTVHGGKLDVRAQAGTLLVGEATLRAADIEASNGVLHVVDKVLLPR